MAYSISYTYDIIDKYTPKLRKIKAVTKAFEARLSRVQKTMDGLNLRLNSSRENISRLSAKVGATTGRFGRLNTRLSKTSSLLNRFNFNAGKTHKSVVKVRGGFNDLSGAAASVAGIIGGSALLNTFVTFEETMLTAKGTTKATDEQFKALSARAKALGITTQFSASQAAAGIEMLGRNGLNTKQILNGAIDSSLLLSAATGTDLANSANIATDVMANFNKKASDLAPIVDQITGVTVSSKFSIDDYRLALGQAGGVAGAVGVSLADFNTSIAAMAPLFSSGSDAGTSFKTFLRRLNPESKEAAAIMEKLNMRFFDADGKMKSMSAIAGVLQKSFAGLTEQQKTYVSSTVFGTDAMRAALGLAATGSDTFDKLAQSIDKVSAKKLAENRMSGLTGTLKRLKSAAEGVLIAMFESGFADILENIGNKFADILRRVAKLNPSLLKIAAISGALAIVIAPLIVGFGILSSAVVTLISPVGIAIAAIAGLITVGTALFSSNANIRDSFLHMWETVKAVAGVFKPFISLWQRFFGDAEGKATLVDAIAASVKALSQIVMFLTKPLRLVADLIDRIIKSGFTTVINKGLGVLSKFVGLKEGLGVKVGGVEGAKTRGKTAAERLENIRRITGMTSTEQNVTADRQAVSATLNGAIKVSADNGTAIKNAEIESSLPGRLGMNLGGA